MDNDVNPSVALLALIDSRVKGGMDRRAAAEFVFRAYPQVAAAHHAGQLIPKASPRPRLPGPGRRVQAHEMVPGRSYVHLCSHEMDGGGIFELAA